MYFTCREKGLWYDILLLIHISIVLCLSSSSAIRWGFVLSFSRQVTISHRILMRHSTFFVSINGTVRGYGELNPLLSFTRRYLKMFPYIDMLLFRLHKLNDRSFRKSYFNEKNNFLAAHVPRLNFSVKSVVNLMFPVNIKKICRTKRAFFSFSVEKTEIIWLMLH